MKHRLRREGSDGVPKCVRYEEVLETTFFIRFLTESANFQYMYEENDAYFEPIMVLPSQVECLLCEITFLGLLVTDALNPSSQFHDDDWNLVRRKSGYTSSKVPLTMYRTVVTGFVCPIR